MSVREEIQFLDSILKSPSVLSSEEDLTQWFGQLCEGLEAAGYEIPQDALELDDFVEAVSVVIDSDESLTEGQKSIFKRMVGAYKAAKARGLAAMPKAVHAQLRSYYAKRAEKAMDKGDTKAYTHHYQQQQFHVKHSNPEGWKATEKNRKDAREPRVGSKKDARYRMYLWKSMKGVHALIKSKHSAQVAAARNKPGSNKTGTVSDRPTSRSTAKTQTATAQSGANTTTVLSHGTHKTLTHHPEPETVRVKSGATASTRSLRRRSA